MCIFFFNSLICILIYALVHEKFVSILFFYSNLCKKISIMRSENRAMTDWIFLKKKINYVVESQDVCVYGFLM